MTKKFKLEISSPCQEDLNKMPANSQGFYCNSCAKNVIDLSQKSNFEVGKIISEIKDKDNICARLHHLQLDQDFSYQIPETKSKLKYAAAIAASVMLATNVAGQEKPSDVKQPTNVVRETFVTGKMIAPKIVKPEQKIVFKFKGTLIDSITKKPLSKKLFPNMMVIIGQSKKVKVNAKTGAFELDLSIATNEKNIVLQINSNEKYCTKQINLNIAAIKNDILLQEIEINPIEFEVEVVELFMLGAVRTINEE